MGTYKEHGEWAVPVFPSNISLVGSVPTPYIHDDRADFRDVAKAIKEVYELPKEERDRRGMAGHDWVRSDEAKMTADAMGANIAHCIEETFESFVPRSTYDLIKVEKLPAKYVKHAMVY